MAKDNGERTELGYRRKAYFPRSLSFGLTEAMREDLESEAVASGESIGAIVRTALARQLPKMRDARKRKTRRTKTGGKR